MSRSMTSEETTESPNPIRNKNVRWIPVAMLYLGVAGFGIMQCFTTNPYLDWAVRLFIAVSAIYWVSLDARAREKPIPHIAQSFLLFLWILVVPMWLIRTRGFRGLGWAVLHAFGLIVAVLVGFYSALLIFWGPESLFQN